MTGRKALALAFLLGLGPPFPSPAQAPSDARTARAFARIVDAFGPEAERRFVRAYGRLERAEFEQLSIEFLRNRETALRRFLSRHPLAAQAHRARILLAETLLYREADAEAEALLKMVILTTDRKALEEEARFALIQLYRRSDPIKARVMLREMANADGDDAFKARACLALASLLDTRAAIAVLRRGGALRDGLYPRRCRLELARLTLRRTRRIAPGQSARPFRIRTVKGEVLTEDSFRSKVYLIYFWSRREPDAEGIRAYLGAMLHALKASGFRIIGVNVDGEPERLKRDVEAGRIPWLEAGDRWGPLTEMALRYAPDPPPHFLLVDRQGVIRFHGGLEAPIATSRYAATPLWKAVVRVLRARRPAPSFSHLERDPAPAPRGADRPAPGGQLPSSNSFSTS